MTFRVWFVSMGLVAAFTGSAAAQEPTSSSSEQRNGSSTIHQPPAPRPGEPPAGEPTFVDKAREGMDETKIIERLEGTADGWYPRFGGIRRGSGFGGGPGYRTHLSSGILVDVSGGISVRNYQTFDARVRWFESVKHRAELWTDYSYDDFTQERFFGIGLQTPQAARTSYGFHNQTVALRAVLRPTSRIQLNAELGYLNPSVYRGNDSEYRPTAEVFTETQAPGITLQPAFLRTTLAADLDLRDAPGNPSRGGVYHVAFGRYNARTLDQYDFTRVDATVTQYIPLTANKRHVIAGRLGLAAATADPGATVPFYFLPYIGGSDTVRSFDEYRFAAENVLWYGAEYTWNPIPYVSTAAFVDAGKAARTWGGLGQVGTKTGYGFGVIGHTSKQTLGRLDVAFGGGEGWRVWFDIGAF